MRTSIRGISIVALALCCSIALAQQTNQPPPPAPAPAAPLAPAEPPGPPPRMELSAESWNFGTKLHGEPAEAEIEIRNAGEGPLLFSLRSSCGCTVAQPSKAEAITDERFQYRLAPGASDSFKVSYNTQKQSRNVNQTITIMSNDPARSVIQFRVTGELRNLWKMTTNGAPNTRISFVNISREEVASSAIDMENEFGEPVKLSLKDKEEVPGFKADLVEVKEGQHYILNVTTNPPLKNGFNGGDFTLETDHPTLKEVKVNVTAYIQPRVWINRPVLTVVKSTTVPVKQRVQMRYRPETPLTITGFQFEPPGLGLEATVLPLPPGLSPEIIAKAPYHDIEMTLPPADLLPPDGAKIIVLTDDFDPEFQRFEVLVRVIDPAARQPSIVRPQGSGGGQRDE